MLPEDALPRREAEGTVHPRWLTPAATMAVAELLDQYEAAVGRPRHALDARLRQLRIEHVDARTVRLLRVVLDGHFACQRGDGPDPPAVRLAAFTAAAAADSREAAIDAAAAELGVAPDAVDRALFADLPGERLVRAPERVPSTAEVIGQANRLLLQGLLCRAEALQVGFAGNPRAVVRQLRACRLIAVVRDRAPEAAFEVALSGPLSLHRRTTIYGRALARFVPALAWCDRWWIRARCLLGDRVMRLACSHRDPVLAERPPPARFDSALEERFHKAFLREAPEWDLAREPRPVRSGEGWVFPDFLARRRDAPDQAVFVELVGFWTREYLERKVAGLRVARMRRYVLCVDEDLQLCEAGLPEGATVVPFRRRVDAKAVVRALDHALRDPA